MWRRQSLWQDAYDLLRLNAADRVREPSPLEPEHRALQGALRPAGLRRL